MSGYLSGILDSIRGRTAQVRATSPAPRRQIPLVHGTRYDSAQTTLDNAKHWAYADGMSANMSAQPGVRLILRNRARYEIANNSYAKGVILTKAGDTIGTGPRLQVTTADAELNRRIEDNWADWWEKRVDGPRKLFTMCQAKIGDGEGFGVLHRYPGISGPVKLGFRLIEAEQCATPPASIPIIPWYIDGIELDEGYNPKSYHVLRWHPGDSALANVGTYDVVPARFMTHWFRADRPGSFRGIPEITPAIDLFAQLRRFTQAVLAAAETAADFAGVLQSQALAGEEADDIEPLDTVELEKRMLTTMPKGWTIGQMKAEQPTTTYAMFKAEILNEIFRCLNMPYNIGACNSSSYNYSSGQLDHQTYDGALRLDQSDCEQQVMEKVFSEWWAEARVAIRELDGSAPIIPHHWMWQRRIAGDPEKDANAATARLSNGTASIPDEYARKGQDFEQEMPKAAAALGVTMPEYQALLRAKLFGTPGAAAVRVAEEDAPTKKATP